MKRRLRSMARPLGRTTLAVLAVLFACAAYVHVTLPDVRRLRTTNPETTAFIELRARQARAAGQQPRRVQQWVRYGRISTHLKRAVLVAEDSAFWQHSGIDLQQIKDSMVINLERLEFARGASTITQQLAKNLYLSPSKNPLRKLKELVIARRLEAELTKQRILEIYLNVIEWGDGIYGAEAAARRYFRKSAADLDQAEAALLAAAIINPRALDPANPGSRLERRQQMIVRRMGAVTPPPVLAETAKPAGGLESLPAPEQLPVVLPGQIVPTRRTPDRPDGEKPPGG